MYYSNEIVFRGHPDKVCDQIADAILDACLDQDKGSRCGVEVAGGKNTIFITGEITSDASIHIPHIVKRVLSDVGYKDKYSIFQDLGKQSQDIALGTNNTVSGAGDNGMMFGYACNETPQLLPKSMLMLQDLSRMYDEERKRNNYFLSDGKAQITGVYDDKFKLKYIDTITVCYQNLEIDRKYTDSTIIGMIQYITEKHNIEVPRNILLNPTGRFRIGGFDGDAGVTGRKIAVDNYHSFSRIGGGAFSGKDPTKVDRSGAYKAREIAKDFLKRYNLDWCEVQLSYSIGIRRPMAIYINSNEGYIEPDDRLYVECEPKNIINDLGLLDKKYEDMARFGHFV